jgi:hypothetical protein
VTGIRSPTEAQEVSSTLCAQPAVGPTQPPVQWVPGALSPGVKCGRGVMLTISGAEVKKERGYTSCHPKHLLWRIADQLHFTFTESTRLKLTVSELDIKGLKIV